MATRDLQAVVDGIDAMTCVVSVEKREDGGYGTIRIVTGNRAYIDSIENPPQGAQMLTKKFVPNSEYTRYLTRDLNFEDYCYRAAVQKKCLHSYAHPDRLDIWFNMTFLPLDADDGDLCYCTYTMEMNFEPNSQQLSSVSGELASRVLEIVIRLRGTNDFARAMGDAVHDMRELCKSEYCCILLADEQERSCSLLAESNAEGSSRSMEGHADARFYEIVESWKDTIAGSNCIVAKNKRDMEIVRERNPRWHDSLVEASIDNVVLFPLKNHGKLLGYIWTVNFDSEDAGRIKETLELATYMLAAEIDNHLLLQRMKILGTTDMLTGVLNRNEMNNRVDAMSDGKMGAGRSVGVVFADLNGLKRVNDNEGHTAGDRLLRNGTKAMSEVFDADSIFRAGGDEFVAIVLGITEAELADKAKALREAAAKNGVSFAMGHCAAADAKDVRTALKAADALMYEDKDAYYGRR